MKGTHTAPKVVTALLVIVIALVCVLAPGALGRGKVEKVPAASGTVLRDHWYVGFFPTKHEEFCSWMAVVPPPDPTAFVSEGSICGPWEAPGFWSPGQGSVGDDYTVELDLTDLDVARVELRVRQRGGGTTVRSIATRRLSLEQARRSQVRRDFRYVVLAGRGELCVVGVTAYDTNGELLGHKELPCEV